MQPNYLNDGSKKNHLDDGMGYNKTQNDPNMKTI